MPVGADYGVIFRIPSNAASDEFHRNNFHFMEAV